MLKIKNLLQANQSRKSIRMSTGDKIFAKTIAKRQSLIISDLMSLQKTYPDLIDSDIIGGLFSLCTLLEDEIESITHR